MSSIAEPVEETEHDAYPLWWDRAVRGTLALMFAAWAGVHASGVIASVRMLGDAPLTLKSFSQTMSMLAVTVFTFSAAVLILVRLRAKGQFPGVFPALASLLGSFLPLGLLFFPARTDLPDGVVIVSSLMILGGNLLTTWAICVLGRSFSILPECRRLVTSGPYRIVRHPLYLTESISTIGAMIHFLSPGACALVAVQIGFQFVRMHYEEKLLAAMFADYAAYRQRTARIIPFLL